MTQNNKIVSSQRNQVYTCALDWSTSRQDEHLIICVFVGVDYGPQVFVLDQALPPGTVCKREGSYSYYRSQGETVRAACVEFFGSIESHLLCPRTKCINISDECWRQAHALLDYAGGMGGLVTGLATNFREFVTKERKAGRINVLCDSQPDPPPPCAGCAGGVPTYTINSVDQWMLIPEPSFV